MVDIASVAGADAEAKRKASMRGLIGACAGYMVEWYDFFIYAYLAIYFAPSFFPDSNQTSQLLATAGVFAVGFFMRPVGGWVFGWIADTKGRKVSMIISVFMMCGGSLLIGLLPTYAAIGVAAPIMLLAARMLQGLSVGAEYGTGATYISEVATKGKRGFFGSFQYFTIILGQLSALFTVFLLQSILTEAEMQAWGWRIPFFIGAAAAIVVVYLRRAMTETAKDKAMHAKEAGSLRGLVPHWRAVLLVMAFTAGGSLYFYTFTTYMQKFLVVTVGFDKTTVTLIMTASLLVFMLAQPVFGMLADRIGVKRNMLLFTGIGTAFVVPILYGIANVQNPFAAFALIVSGLLIATFYTPVSGLVKADMFPASVRALGVGFPYALANACFGGTAEYAALFLRSHGIGDVYYYYVAALLCIAFIAAVLMPDLRRHGYLDGDGQIERNTGLKTRAARRASV